MASPISGKAGNVLIGASAISELRNWKHNRKANNHAYASNATGGYKKRVAGVFDSSGSFEMLDDPANNSPALEVGDTATLILKTTAAITQKTVPAIIDSIDANVDLDEGAIVGYTIGFSGNGAWS